MRLIIHDLEEGYNDKINNVFTKDRTENYIISDNGTIKHCIGCFDCWVKTPGKCTRKDQYNNIGELAAKTKELVIISRCIYGGYSPFVKNVLDRSISYVHPDFTKRSEEIHHKARYKNQFKINVYFYGKIEEEEKDTARKIVKANLLNFNGIEGIVKFLDSQEEIFNESYIN